MKVTDELSIRENIMHHSIWPIALVVVANVIYNICTKATPAGAQPFAALAVTYAVATLVSMTLYFFFNTEQNLLLDLRRLNWSSLMLGVSVVALEFGYIQVYRVGWNISIGSLVANIALAIALLIVGLLFYHEQISARKMLGAALCLAGIVLVGR
ncbi:MAG: EamA family transporter [Oscillospiraceae bacterium]